MPFVTMDDDSDDTMDPSMGETMDTNMDVPVQNGSMGSNNESTGTNKAESVNDIWFTTLDDQEVTIDDDDDESTIDNDDDSLSWISVEEKNPTTWSKIKNILIVIGILGLIAGGSIAAVYLAPSEKEIKLLDNLQDKEIQARAQMMTSIPWDDTLKYKNSKFYQEKSAESKENLRYDFLITHFNAMISLNLIKNR